MATHVRPLADTLNDPSTDFIQVDNIYVSPIQSPADIKANYDVGAIRKENISIVVVVREEDGRPTSAAYGSYMGRILRPVFLTVPGFEIRGFVEMQPQADIRTYMVNAERFIPISDGKAAVSLNPDLTFQGGIILVHKENIGIFCMLEEEA